MLSSFCAFKVTYKINQLSRPTIEKLIEIPIFKSDRDIFFRYYIHRCMTLDNIII